MPKKITYILQKIQVFAIKNKNLIIRIFQLFEISLLIFAGIFTFYAYNNFTETALLIYDLGKNFGILALIFFMITMIPGILKRLQLFPEISNPVIITITLFRRHLGIIMFLLAFIHNLFSRLLPMIVRYGFGPELSNLATFELMGSISLLILFPVWLTSNDFSQKKLGKFWKKLQSLTYIAIFFIFMHVALQNSNWAIAAFVIIIAQVASWIKVTLNAKNK